MDYRIWYEIKDIYLCWAINTVASTDSCVHPFLFLVTWQKIPLWTVVCQSKVEMRFEVVWGKTLQQFKKSSSSPFSQAVNSIVYLHFQYNNHHSLWPLATEWEFLFPLSSNSLQSHQSSLLHSLPLSLFLPIWLSLFLWHYLMFFWSCIMNWLYINYQLDALTIIYS